MYVEGSRELYAATSAGCQYAARSKAVVREPVDNCHGVVLDCHLFLASPQN